MYMYNYEGLILHVLLISVHTVHVHYMVSLHFDTLYIHTDIITVDKGLRVS